MEMGSQHSSIRYGTKNANNANNVHRAVEEEPPDIKTISLGLLEEVATYVQTQAPLVVVVGWRMLGRRMLLISSSLFLSSVLRTTTTVKALWEMKCRLVNSI